MLIKDEIESIDFLKSRLDFKTFSSLENYRNIVSEQTKFINLISKNTIDQIWQRHILDSYQLINHIDLSDIVIDIGSGAGFPGIILKILGIKKITMIDSSNKKVKFINQTLEKLSFSPCALHSRVENCNYLIDCESDSRIKNKPIFIDVLTARALKPLNEILELISSSIRVRKKILLLKGSKINEEIKEAQKNWRFVYNLFPSITSGDSFIIEITDYYRK